MVKITDPNQGDPRARGTYRMIARPGPDGEFDMGSVTDRVIALVCPHRPRTYHIAPDLRNGRLLFTCFPCRMSWYADHVERLSR